MYKVHLSLTTGNGAWTRCSVCLLICQVSYLFNVCTLDAPNAYYLILLWSPSGINFFRSHEGSSVDRQLLTVSRLLEKTNSTSVHQDQHSGFEHLECPITSVCCIPISLFISVFCRCSILWEKPEKWPQLRTVPYRICLNSVSSTSSPVHCIQSLSSMFIHSALFSLALASDTDCIHKNFHGEIHGCMNCGLESRILICIHLGCSI